MPIICKYLFYVDIVTHFPIDYMHALCLNIFKHFLTYWFSSKYSTQPFSLYIKKNIIEKHYLQLKFPYFKNRAPRKLEDFDDWKAVELRSYLTIVTIINIRDFFLFAVPVILWEQLSTLRYNHLRLLVDAVWMLMFSFSASQLLEAKNKVILTYLTINNLS